MEDPPELLNWARDTMNGITVPRWRKAVAAVGCVAAAVALCGCGKRQAADAIYSHANVAHIFAQAGEPLISSPLIPAIRQRGITGFFHGAGENRAALTVIVYDRQILGPRSACGDGSIGPCTDVVERVRNVLISFSTTFAQGSAPDVRRIRRAIQSLRKS